jgi:hypothetical protein
MKKMANAAIVIAHVEPTLMRPRLDADMRRSRHN